MRNNIATLRLPAAKEPETALCWLVGETAHSSGASRCSAFEAVKHRSLLGEENTLRSY